MKTTIYVATITAICLVSSIASAGPGGIPPGRSVFSASGGAYGGGGSNHSNGNPISRFFNWMSTHAFQQNCCYRDPRTGTSYIVPTPVYGRLSSDHGGGPGNGRTPNFTGGGDH
jgi:hypothetical protein